MQLKASQNVGYHKKFFSWQWTLKQVAGQGYCYNALEALLHILKKYNITALKHVYRLVCNIEQRDKW
jgi:hypothetical protein